MDNSSIASKILDPQEPLSLEQLARHIRARNKRMREIDADRVRLAMASVGDVAAGRQFLKHGEWLPWLKKACELRQRQALNYVVLAQHRKAVEAYLHSCANTGRTPSIIGALRLISPRDDQPKKPKRLTEVEQATALGRHKEPFWAALQLAPELKAEIEQRLQRPLGRRDVKARAKAAKELPAAPLVARGDTASIH